MTEPVDQFHQPEAHEDWPLIKRVKDEWSTLLKLGAPILVGQLAQMSNGVIDTVMAGRASADDLTGVAIGNSLWVPMFLFMIGILNATQPMISGHRGAKEFNKIMPVTWNAIYIGLASAVIAIFTLIYIDPIFSLIGLEENAARICNGYLEAFVWGIPAIMVLVSLRGLTDGLGFTKIFMVFSILTACINAPLNYIFIFGKFGISPMGGIGCGWATAISNWIALILALLYVHDSPKFKDYHLWEHRNWPNRNSILGILKLGIPIGFTIFVESTMFSVIALLLASLGTDIVAGHQIALNVVSVLFMVPLSIGAALTLRISYLMGAKNPDSARLVARSSIILVLCIAFSYAAILFVFAEPIAKIYTTELAVIAVATTLLSYGAMFQIADVLQVVCISALRGYKDTRIPMYIMVSSFWGIGVPLGYILAFKDWLVEPLGAPGFWIGMIASLCHAAFWLLIRLFLYSRKPKKEF